MIERLEAIEKKYNEIKKDLTNPEVMSDFNKIRTLSKEASDLEETVVKYNEYKKVLNDIEDAKTLMKDDELKEIATEELNNLKAQEEKIKRELEILLVPKDEFDGKNIIMEIRGAAGGDEANIFAGDLYRMYSHYAEKNGWKIEEIHAVEGSSGGFSQIEVMIKGEDVYKKLKYESGSHRVQRVPVTETQGRVHTSTATVLVMPEVETSNIEIKEIYIPLIKSEYKQDELNLLKNECNFTPRILDININNYQGTISVTCDKTNKIEWFDDKLNLLDTKYNFGKKFYTSISVKDLRCSYLKFKLTGEYGEKVTKKFYLIECK